MGYVLLWVAVIVVWRWAANGGEEHRATQRVESLDIHVEGSSNELVDARLMSEWFASHGISPVGRTLAEVDLAEVERVALQHSAVASVNAYLTHDGRIDVTVAQREPMVRLRVEGYDMYITEDGYVFPASDGYAVLVPVVTGSYKPIFAPDYSGYVHSVVRDSVAAITGVIAELETAKIPHYKLRKEYNREMRTVLNSSVRRELFMSDYEYTKRKEELEERKVAARRENEERNDRIDVELRALEQKQEVQREQQRLIEGVGNDFDNLMCLIRSIADDSFWRAEVVQILLDGGGREPMQLAFIPRSGNFVVDMGYAESMEDKLTTLQRFYDKGLNNVGWDRYSRISVRYDGQVVCI